ncbi:MAG: hypothetical protein ACYC8V_05745 [Caulobacteraceae bacterium]
MNGAAAHLPEMGRTRAWRLVVTWILLFAFALQSYVTQTHVHRAPIVDVVGKIYVHSPSPVDDEATACPFCQAIATAGAFFSPAAVEVFPLVLRAEAAALSPIVVGLAIAPAGFSWRSRAPPQS